ncbi:uncharacterized protein [Chiloscyllium punctatum]|uniref:uncharacterized protein isoform X1 n=1 Tax=Chiloscyllium punctatum TaxID=137246 RepID=UPI003B63C409
MLSALSLVVLTQAVVVTGSVQHGQGECPVVYFDGSHPVVLNCSNPSYARAPLVQWRWTDLFGKRKEQLLLQVLNGDVSRHADWADVGISFKACAGNGNCSLTVTPTQDYAGLYHCVVWTSKRITEEKMWLTYEDHGPLVLDSPGRQKPPCCVYRVLACGAQDARRDLRDSGSWRGDARAGPNRARLVLQEESERSGNSECCIPESSRKQANRKFNVYGTQLKRAGSVQQPDTVRRRPGRT